jgi:peptide/nickel transport system ATP-binding protein
MAYVRPGCRITRGEIVFKGTDLRSLSPQRIRKLRGSRIAYVAQSAAAAFNPAQRLIDQYVEVAVQHRIKSREQASAEAVQRFRMFSLPNPETFGQRFPHQVSGGQLQRAMVAMAMACDPDLIVFDEPTTALDVTTQIEVLASIKQAVRNTGTAGIYITHDLAVVAQMADNIMVLRHGKMVEEGPVRQILENPAQDYTRRLLHARSAAKPQEAGDAQLLHVEEVDASYRAFKALERVSLKLPVGRTVAVVGESGSGKSTLARVICGLMPASAGAIYFKGEKLGNSIASRRKDTLRRIQMIFQMPDTALNPRQKIREILGRPLDLYFGFDRAEHETRLRELMEMIELPHAMLEQYPEELSGGQKQRVCISRALAASPDLIICDEVTSALDQLVAEGIIKLLMKLQKELDVSYLFITHDIDVVRAIADEVVVMHGGKVVERGMKNEILTSPGTAYTRKLLDSVPHLDPGWLDSILEKRKEGGAGL